MDYCKLSDDGKPQASRRAMLRQVAKTKGEEIRFDDDELDMAQSFYIGLFHSLFHVEHGIRYSDFYYYEQVSGLRLDADERAMLQEIAAALLRFYNDKRAEHGRKKPINKSSSRRR